MDAKKLKSLLKLKREHLPNQHAVRLHRAISWLKCAEDVKDNLDIQYISRWISFNACYANNMTRGELLTEKERFGGFVSKLVKHDTEMRFFHLLWNQFSGPVRLLIENQYVYKPFWDFHRGEIKDWKKSYTKSVQDSMKYLSNQNVEGLLEVVLDRLYTLRNQLMHGGATFKSDVNRSQVKDGNNMLKLLVPIIIEIMLNNEEEDWGKIHYPVID
jgi:hypothetical protein